ncbi:hypothetical protein RB653_007232 [Dictyostelium firmibasis]|uniref:Uncharacterized protein n=1 Tax=Dictyostelium firmibasis TaxID=79012 RepID=A0AAN7YLW6_9MYCE
MNEYNFIARGDGYTLDSIFPKQLNGVMTPKEFSDILDGFHSKVKRLPPIIYIILPIMALLIFLVRFFSLGFLQFLIIMAILLAIDLVVLIFIIVIYIINKIRFKGLIQSLNDQYQYRSISFYSASLLFFKLKMHYPDFIQTGAVTPGGDSFITENSPLIISSV